MICLICGEEMLPMPLVYEAIVLIAANTYSREILEN